LTHHNIGTSKKEQEKSSLPQLKQTAFDDTAGYEYDVAIRNQREERYLSNQSSSSVLSIRNPQKQQFNNTRDVVAGTVS